MMVEETRPRGTRAEHGPVVYYVLASEQFPTADLVEYGHAAELAGFQGVWSSDHFQPWQANEEHSGSAWVTLSALTQRTSRIAIGSGVTCPIFRYRPAVVAQAWASLSQLAPGRMFLGVGSGEKLNEGAAGGGWAPYDERAARLVEAVKIIRALWSGEQVHIQGRFWDVDGRLYDPPATPIPLYIAAGGPKSALLAGLHGDGLITSAKALGSRPELKAAWEKGVRETGRDPATLPIVVEHWAMVGGEDEARDGAEKWRFAPKAWEPGYFDNVDPVEIQAKAEKEVPLERVLRDWTVSRDPEVHTGAIRKLGELGATHVVVHVASPNQLQVIDYFGREVLPVV
jgi:TAT-translocated FGD2 family F420-dependent dehydrogenase